MILGLYIITGSRTAQNQTILKVPKGNKIGFRTIFTKVGVTL